MAVTIEGCCIGLDSAKAENSDIVLCLAGVSKHAGLRVIGNEQWRISHSLRTESDLFDIAVYFSAT